MPLTLRIYSKPDCCLCDLAKERLLELQAELAFDLEEIDISTDAALLARYGRYIPVVEWNGEELCRYRVNKKRLREKLLSVSGGSGGCGRWQCCCGERPRGGLAGPSANLWIRVEKFEAVPESGAHDEVLWESCL